MKKLTSLIFMLILFVGISSVKIQSQQQEKITMKDSTVVAVIKTNMGTIEIELFEKQTPKTVENFIGLANKGYYDGVIFHRVIDNFICRNFIRHNPITTTG